MFLSILDSEAHSVKGIMFLSILDSETHSVKGIMLLSILDSETLNEGDPWATLNLLFLLVRPSGCFYFSICWVPTATLILVLGQSQQLLLFLILSIKVSHLSTPPPLSLSHSSQGTRWVDRWLTTQIHIHDILNGAKTTKDHKRSRKPDVQPFETSTRGRHDTLVLPFPTQHYSWRTDKKWQIQWFLTVKENKQHWLGQTKSDRSNDSLQWRKTSSTD